MKNDEHQRMITIVHGSDGRRRCPMFLLDILLDRIVTRREVREVYERLFFKGHRFTPKRVMINQILSGRIDSLDVTDAILAACPGEFTIRDMDEKRLWCRP